jgi:hypothetical protein
MAALRASLAAILIALVPLALVAWWSMSTASGSALSLSGSAPNVQALKLVPSQVVVPAGTPQSYRAIGVDQNGNEMDLTAQTDFTIDKGGACNGASCTATKAQAYTVTGTLRDPRLSATATLIVTDGTPTTPTISPACCCPPTTTTPPTTSGCCCPPSTEPPTTSGCCCPPTTEPPTTEPPTTEPPTTEPPTTEPPTTEPPTTEPPTTEPPTT